MLLNPSTGAPLTGAAGACSFATYKDDQGTNLTPPSISEVGGGIYKFVPTLPADPARGLVYVISTGGNVPGYVWRYVRPEDWNTDRVTDIVAAVLGRAKIFSTGPDANRLVIYAEDGVTVIAKFDLKDLAGAPNITSPTERVRV